MVSAGDKALGIDQRSLSSLLDPAVANELKILNQAEAASAEKSKASMRGYVRCMIASTRLNSLTYLTRIFQLHQ